VEQFLTFGEIERKVLTELESLILLSNKPLPVLFYQLYMIDIISSTFVTLLYLFQNKTCCLECEQRN